MSEIAATLCLLNPHAGSGRALALREPLAAALGGLALVVPNSVAHAQAELAALPRGSRVIVVGGDGTVQGLLDALVAQGHVLALVPAGTGNDLARALGLRDLRWRTALQRALTHPARAIDLGRLEVTGQPTRHFMSSLTAGFDAAVGLRALSLPGWLRGMPRYSAAALAELCRLRVQPLRWQVDDAPAREEAVLFASSLNTPTYASGMRAAPDARIDDGWLDLVVAGAFSRLGVLPMMPLLMAGRHTRHPRVTMQRYRRLHVSAAQALPLALDGNPIAAEAAFGVQVSPRALRVVA